MSLEITDVNEFIICNCIISYEKKLVKPSKVLKFEYCNYLLDIIQKNLNVSLLQIIFTALGNVYDIPDNFEETEFFNKYLLTENYSLYFFSNDDVLPQITEYLYNIKNENIHFQLPMNSNSDVSIQEMNIPFMKNEGNNDYIHIFIYSEIDLEYKIIHLPLNKLENYISNSNEKSFIIRK